MRPLPKTVGKYRVIAKLGQGGMATALLALSEGPGGFRKLSVIKQLRLDLCEDPEFVAMFLDEARIAALLNHPNVVQTNEVGSEGSIRFISMEYLQGQSLSRVLYRVQGRLPLGMHIRVLIEALSGLHYVHELRDLSGEELRVVHRDISPGNLFLTYDGDIKVLDFGIAKAEGSSAKTEVGSFKGKMAYVAPEQARATEVDRRADVFSMGVLLWEALARHPFVSREEDDIITLENRVKGLEESIDLAAPDSPKALRDVCKKAMAVNPDERYSSAEEYRDALEEAARGLKGASRGELATVMKKLFEDERAAIAATIARTISNNDPFKSDVEMLSSWEASTSISMKQVVYDEAITQEITKDDYAGFEPFSQVESPSQVEPSSLASTVLPLTILAKKKASYRTAALSVVGLSLIIGIAAYFTGSGASESEGKAAAQPVVSNPSSPPTPVVVPLKATISLDIEVVPEQATIRIDGRGLSSNPYSTRLGLSSEEHELVASAPGYQTKRQTLRFDKDVDLHIALVKIDAEALKAAEAKAAERLAKEREISSKAEKRAQREKARRDKAREDTKAAGKLGSEKGSKKPKKPEKKNPAPGDPLRGKRDKETLKIDKDNPYN